MDRLWWAGSYIPVEWALTRKSTGKALFRLGSGSRNIWALAKYDGQLYVAAPMPYKDRRVHLFRAGKEVGEADWEQVEGLFAVRFEVLYAGEWFVVFGVGRGPDCREDKFKILVEDPEFKTPFHSMHTSYMWGDGAEMDSGYAEAVRMHLSRSLKQDIGYVWHIS